MKESAYAKQLKEKDAQIAELKAQNFAFIEVSIKQSKRIVELTEKLKILTKK